MRRKPLSARRHVPLEGEPVPAPPPQAPAASGSRRPLVAALVPDPDVWRVCGAGRTLVARRRADGRVAWASLVFDLKRPAALTFFGNAETEEGPFEEILDALYRIDDAPPMVGGSPSLASRFTHGALAFSRTSGCEVALDETLLSVFDDPRTSDPQRVKALVGDDGLCPRELVETCRQEAAAALPEGESLAVHVAMAFRAAAPSELGGALAADGDFSRNDGELHWKPARAGAARLGSVYIEGEHVEAETVSLDLAGLLCARLKRLAQGALELVRVEHVPL